LLGQRLIGVVGRGEQARHFASLDEVLALDVGDGIAPTPKGTYVGVLKLKVIVVRAVRTKAHK
jgi:hypothetical protein